MFLAYVGGFNTYTARCEEIAKGGYKGFRFSAAKSGKPDLQPA